MALFNVFDDVDDLIFLSNRGILQKIESILMEEWNNNNNKKKD